MPLDIPIYVYICKMRLSDYTIPIEIDSQRNKVLLLHGYTGAIDIVSKEVFEAMTSCQSLSKDNLLTLQSRGYITEKSPNEEKLHIERLANIFLKRNRTYKKDFTFIVSYSCNFKCPYCFEKNRINKPTNNHLQKRDVERLFEAMLEIEPNRALHNDVITLFGGEPLLKSNLDIVEQIVSIGVKLNYKFTVTTNGYDLDSFLHLISKDKIFGVQITLDGTKEIHDKRRIHQSDKGSFSKIINNIKLVLEKGGLVKVRTNVDSSNLLNIKDLVSFLENQGFLNNPNFRLYTEYISGEGNFCPNEYEEDSRTISIDEYIKEMTLEQITVPLDFTLFNNINNAITKGQPLFLNIQHCGANAFSYILDPNGNIYTCHEFVGTNENIVGKYKPVLIWEKDCLSLWHNRNIINLQ